MPTLTYDSGESTCFQLNVRHLFTSTPYSHDQQTSQNGEKRAPSQEISPGHSKLRSTQAAGTCLDLVGWSLRAEPRLRRVRRKGGTHIPVLPGVRTSFSFLPGLVLCSLERGLPRACWRSPPHPGSLPAWGGRWAEIQGPWWVWPEC